MNQSKLEDKIRKLKELFIKNEKLEEIKKIEKEISVNLLEFVKFDSFYDLPLSSIDRIVKQTDIEEDIEEEFDSIKEIIQKTIKKYNKDAIFLLNSFDFSRFSLDYCYSILSLFENSFSFFKILINLKNEQETMPCFDFDYEIEMKDKEIDQLKTKMDNFKSIMVHKNDSLMNKPKIHSENIVDAAYHKYDDSVKYIINNCVNYRDSNGSTALTWAAATNNLNLAKYLVWHGADIEITNKYYASPIQIAAWNGSYDVFVFLAELGADFEHRNGKRFTSLISAAKVGSLPIVKYLVEHGANIEGKDKWGYTALYRANLKKHEDVVKYLIEAGANQEEMNKSKEFDKDDS